MGYVTEVKRSGYIVRCRITAEKPCDAVIEDADGKPLMSFSLPHAVLERDLIGSLVGVKPGRIRLSCTEKASACVWVVYEDTPGRTYDDIIHDLTYNKADMLTLFSEGSHGSVY